MPVNSGRLIELRGERSQRDIEAETGISQSTISGYESGTAKRPDVAKLRVLANFYGVPLDEIYTARAPERPVPRGDEALQELILAWSELPPDQRAELLELARALVRIAQRRREAESDSRRSPDRP